MDYLYVPSYSSVFFALYKNKLGPVTVITCNKNIELLLKKFKIECVFIKEKYSIYGLNKTKKELDEINKCCLPNSSFYLLDNIFCVEGFYLAKHWKNGKVFYENLSTECPLFRGKPSFKKLIEKQFLKFFYKLPLVFRDKSGIPVLAFDPVKFGNSKFEKLSMPKSYEDIKLEIIFNSQIEDRKAQNLWIDQGLLTRFIDSDFFLNILDYIIEHNSFFYKLHPYHKNTIEFPDEKKYSTYIPSEFLFQNITNAVVSVYSFSLISASKFSHLKAISILDLVEWNNHKYKADVKSILIEKSGNKILFPEKLDHLKELL